VKSNFDVVFLAACVHVPTMIRALENCIQILWAFVVAFAILTAANALLGCASDDHSDTTKKWDSNGMPNFGPSAFHVESAGANHVESGKGQEP